MQKKCNLKLHLPGTAPEITKQNASAKHETKKEQPQVALFILLDVINAFFPRWIKL